ncbi:hypothetical protein PV10_01410 [Exophiala mesophila]|uniref:Zn(2)-C6 fungal-type domain-containing protein n=1 Tax=Exophiala mesophila TaxID=212818 RepID=A0A0D1ZSZ4_EXOME|nr:uncharacterized protein PV10_01410 [Exophiala mesophila]KIV97697.1 hypothetical protein PV10_01410 [Exophiala mesophila]
MPGILPMKMIRVGSSAASRIAQACDRCRSKKIRCDGIRPTCTQCANVGFECKTSDKLSRRAFPRGYTESLEDRVRGLEAEVKELKDLLDEKDEKIDMLSRIHSFSPPSRKCSASLSPSHAAEVKAEVDSIREETLHVEIPIPVSPKATSTGTSTVPSFIEAFEQKIQDTGGDVTVISSTPLLKAIQCTRSTVNAKFPPRILSDQYINLFFQEWQPLLPILHRPTFLRVYEQYVTNPETGNWQNNKQSLAQLFLIFEIAALSSMSTSKKATPSYEHHWRKALYSTSSTACLSTLQCHLLAQVCYLLRADHTHLTRHRSIAVSMCHELGLHQDHKYHNLSPLEAETKKKVFWAQYVLDKFASATTGTPMLLRDSDITTEYPADVDDENLSSQGFSPTLPGELTKISSALALFRVTRVLAKVLEHLYPAKASYQLSVTKLHALSDELDQWSEELPEHLRLRFCNDKPATHLISCRSPLLSLAYFYTRSLIHRPLLCHSSGSAASAASIVLAAAGKHLSQILDLLIERRMNYTFPLNKTDLILDATFSIMWQSLDLEDDSKLVKDNSKSVMLLLSILGTENPPAATELRKIAGKFVAMDAQAQSSSNESSAFNSPSSANSSMAAPVTTPADAKSKSTRKQIQAIASRWSSFSNKGKPEDGQKRSSVPQISPPMSVQNGGSVERAGSIVSVSSARSAPILPKQPTVAVGLPPQTIDPPAINLDYLPLTDFMHSPSRTSSSTMLPPRKELTPTIADPSWEQLLGNFDGSQAALYAELPDNGQALYPSVSNDWAPDAWHLGPEAFCSKANVPQSLLSFSEESLTSGDDFLFSAPPSNNGSTATEQIDLGDRYRGITMPVDDDFDLHGLQA